MSWVAAAKADAILSVCESLCLRELPEAYGGSGAGLGFDGCRGRFRYTRLLGVCYDWLSSKIREAYEDEQGRRRALVQRERSKARQSGWRQDVLSE